MANTKRIMVIDDDAQLVDSIKTLLEGAGYEVSSAYQPAKGMALAREIRPDLIVMDILFAGPAGPDGVEVSRQLARDPALKDIPVIILSGVKRALDMPVKLGPDEAYMPVQSFLEKPFKPSELLETVQQLLALRDSVKERGMGTILVVDDDPDFLTISARVLQVAGYEVVTAANGARALAAMREQKPDLVLLDVMMSSILEGVDVSREIAQDPDLQGIPIIMVSSIATTEHAAQFPDSESIPIEGWISKPIQPKVLLQTVQRFLA
jgi:CheY-like chemotaxis protein